MTCTLDSQCSYKIGHNLICNCMNGLQCRFPMKNEPVVLEQWENIVKQENMLHWKATSSRRICSNHFERTDYIILPSSSILACRLKSNALIQYFHHMNVKNH